MSVDTVRQALYNWLKRESGVTTILAEQSEQRPGRPYASLKFVNSSVRVGGIDEQRVSGQQTKTVGLRRTVASINVYGAGALDIISKVRDSLDRPDVIAEFDAAGFAHIGEDGPRDLTEMLETAYETRGQMDLILMVGVESDLTDVGTIEHVTVTGPFNPALQVN